MSFEEIMEFISSILPIIWIVVAAVAVWALIEFIVTMKRVRSGVDKVQTGIEPTLANAEQITASIKPAAAKMEPLVDRVSLTVDAANLEIMRVDSILEDVGEVTDKVSGVATLVSGAAKGPLEFIGAVATKVIDAAKTYTGVNEDQDVNAAARATAQSAMKAQAKGVGEAAVDAIHTFVEEA
ncbi:MAG: DUF948 domain-containing protein, partial [Eggerthellaceae bacterium]|nr:DUF948 domain-containing protein [Eggerthellaceae bacterium]